jgi:dTDP-4-dehydrorhamnose 3,5-epimerase
VDVRPLSIEGSWVITPVQHGDERGVFLEWFQTDQLAAVVGHRPAWKQANCSVSRRGTLRGIHFADVPPGQAKYVTCLHGAVLDVVVDLRVGSPTFGRWDSALLDGTDRRAVYLAEGLGHGLMALTDEATVGYLCSEPYAPGREHGLNPFDPALGIAWPEGIEPVLSAKDADAPTLSEAADQGRLPSYADCRGLYAALRSRGTA